MKEKIIVAIGFDLSTTALSLAGRTGSGEEVFVSLPMRGATFWKKQPAFELGWLPGLFIDALVEMVSRGFEFASNGVISGSVRQHDMVVLGTDGRLLLPALSWQCNAPTEEVVRLQYLGAEDIVGRLEPRLVLPKLLWAINQEPSLRAKPVLVMTTGDFFAMQLIGAQTLSSSEALSNGLLSQRTRKFAQGFISSVAGLDCCRFPPVIQSGQVIPSKPDTVYCSPDWNQVRQMLSGWRVVAGLGDNHAGAVGSGLSDRHTIVISAGTSGTIVRACKADARIVGQALRFEYYDNILLLMMMADCASWYNRFIDQFCPEATHGQLNALALDRSKPLYILPYPPSTPFPSWFKNLNLSQQVRSLQYSIAYHLLANFTQILRAAMDDEHKISRVVLTGGLTASEFFRDSLKILIRETGFEGKVLASGRQGPLANQAACLGALINALVGDGQFRNLKEAVDALCPIREI